MDLKTINKSEFFEKLALYACQYYNEKLPKKGKPSSAKNEWTTMAAIVQTEEQNNMKVVALGTGTKCIGQNELSPNGDLLSDSHAEAIARRSFQLYIYDQIFQTLSEDNPTSVFILNKNTKRAQFELLPHIKYHLFVSHVPCGDASIFSIPVADDTDQDEIDDLSPATKKRKIDLVDHRTGAKLNAGDGEYEDVQTVGKCRVKPGKGDPTISMSCSDKIAKWQLLGLQGSFLGNFVPTPIVFESIIVGGSVPFDAAALKRAIIERFHLSIREKIKDSWSSRPVLPEIEVYQSSVNFMQFPEEGGVPAPSSISGYFKEIDKTFNVEVTVNGRKQGVTKKNFGKPIARSSICRKNMFQVFTKTLNTYEERLKIPLFKISSDLTYSDAKKLNTSYAEMWRSLKKKVMVGWTAKSKSLSRFTSEDS